MPRAGSQASRRRDQRRGTSGGLRKTRSHDSADDAGSPGVLARPSRCSARQDAAVQPDAVLALAAARCRPGRGRAPAQSFFERLFGPPPGSPRRRSRSAGAAIPRPQCRGPSHAAAAPAQPRRRAHGRAGQAPSRPASRSSRPPRPPAEPPPPPYEKELLRLAEIIGSLAFLRSLCTTPDAAEWPQRMQLLLEAEGTTPGRKERLAGAYNKGYQAFAITYRVCTPSATEATNRYLKEGDQIAREPRRAATAADLSTLFRSRRRIALTASQGDAGGGAARSLDSPQDLAQPPTRGHGHERQRRFPRRPPGVRAPSSRPR